MVIKPPSPPCSDTPVVLAFSNRRAQKESVGYPYESRHLGNRPTTSDLPLKTDLVRAGCHVSKVPPADSCTVAIERRRRSAKDHQLSSCRPLLVPSYKKSLTFGDAALSQPSSTNRLHFAGLYCGPCICCHLAQGVWEATCGCHLHRPSPFGSINSISRPEAFHKRPAVQKPLSVSNARRSN
jgi:hypothetical protein